MFRRLRTVRSGFSTFTSSWLRISLAMAFCSLALALSVTFAPSSLSAARAALASSTSTMQITPGNGNTLTESSGPLTFTGGPYLVPNPSSQVDGNPICNAALPCDEYTFNIAVSDTTSRTKYARIEVNWPVVGEAQFDLYVFDGTTASGKLIAKSLGDQTYVAPDVALIPAVPATNGVYTLRLVPFLPFGQSITGRINLVDIPTAAPADPGAAPSFSNHVSSGGLGDNAGEPSIGIDWAPKVASLRNDANKTNTGGVAFFQSGANTLRVSFDDRTTPATAIWEDKSAATVQQFVLSDPIGFVDRQTGRVFSLDLIGGEGNSLAAFSDDDGNSWTPMQGGGAPAGPDHQTIGGGPFNNTAVPAPPPHPLYPNAIYYCSQNIVGGAECSRSDDGGLTFGPGVDMFTPTQCYGGIHGHVKVAPDGTVYVPNSSCTSGNGGSQGMAVSRDNGLTWHDSTVPTSTGSGDPSVGIDADNNVFIGYVNADGRPHIAVSANHGDTWSKDYDVGVPVGCNAAADPNPAYAACRIKSAVFPVVVAGDKGRAAFGFVGTTTSGNSQDEATFQGLWHFYVATTYDGGNTWSTVNATPGDPVQKGSICLGGLTCGNDRNLLDFNDMSIDREGRVVAAYADGCVASAGCVAPNYTGRSSKAAIVRQADGRRMFATFDPSGTPTPTPTPTPVPDNPCFAPGPVVVNDGATNDATDGLSVHDIISTSVAYPYVSDSTPDQLIFTIKVGSLTALTPGSFYYSSFTVDGAPAAAGKVYGVRMIVSATGAATFESYLAGASNGGTVDGRFVTSSLPAEAGSNYNANGTITIIVKPANVGVNGSGHSLTNWNGAVATTAAGVITGILDAMPSGSATTTITRGGNNLPVNSNQSCKVGGTPTPTPTPTPTATPTPTVSPTATPTPLPGGAPSYLNYYPPSGVAEDFGEPSIGANWKSGKIMFFGGFSPYALRVGFNDATTPATVTWDQTALLVAATPRVAGDPILFTDRDTGRTFVSQLFGLTPFNGMDYTDDDGATYLPSMGSGIGSGVDHQTIGGGPFHAPIPNGATYPHSVYYCAQEGLNSSGNGIANCALSIDGGVTFGPAVPVYALSVNGCFPLHGHMKVGPDGTTYLPNRKCGAGAGLVLTEDNGLTWTARTVPNSSVGDSDASLGIATDGTLFLGYEGSDGHAYISVSRDKGTNWTNPVDVGTQLGLQNAIFPAVVAGDGGPNARAAFAFYGSTSPGDQDDPAYRGDWYLFVSSTFDGGQTWTTVNATPGDPIQRDGICTRGFQGCTVPRNLLDFFDATVDKEGRVVVGYQDGCMGACVQSGPNSNTKKGVIARQSGGKRMLAAFDSGNPTPTPTPTPSVTPTPTPMPTPVPVYQKGGITFSPNVATRASVASRDGEPSVRVDKFGNTYVAGIRGVPAGVDLWYFDLNPSSPTYDPFMRNPIYRGQPDQFSPDESIEVGADGGGDVDLAVGFDESSAGKPPYLAFSSLTAANISTANSTDRGQTFSKNPAGNVTGGIPADDRQWMEFLGKDSVYLIYRTLEPAIALVQRSNDGGFSYGPAREVGTIGQVGGVSVDQNDGTVYIAGGNGIIAVGTPASPGAEPLTYTLHNVVSAGNAHLFFTVKAAKDGTVYVCYSDGRNVYIRWSKDKGNTWSPGVRVSDGPETATSIVPWLETGSTPGSIGVVWYGTTASSNNDNADWKVFFAQSLNATDANPIIRQVELSDHFIHGSNISEGGLPITPGAAPNRNLLDYFQIGFDPTGAAVVAYTDDHNDFDGNVYVARQISGPGVKGSDVPAPIPGSALPQPTPRPVGAPQVTDYAQDSKTGLLTILPLNDPLDILSVKYSTEGTASNPVLVATMKVSDLSIVPPLANWRMNFTANAPDSRISPTGDYSFGLSDRGDQFFVRATTDALGTKTYTYGTAIREHQHRGFVAYTDVGAADSGSFDSAAGTITVKVSLSKLNATLAAGRTPIGPGSIFAGLRAGTFTTGDDNPADRNDRAKSDVARGGTQYAINSAPTATLSANPTSGAPPLLVNFDGSGSSDPDAGDSLSYTFDFGDGSAPVTQSTPTVAHTYNQLNKFTASLTVKDQLGFSSNPVTVQIDVTNRVPTAALSATPSNGYAPLPVNFDGSASSDPDAGDSVASYTFDFGDGAVVTQAGAKVAHTYNAGGIYTARLTVADTHGGASTNTAQVQITVNNRPTIDCMEEDDARIAYSDGWHNGTSINASAGHFRWHQGKSTSHTAGVDFNVPANGTGTFSYRYAKSTKGGTAQVFIDGVLRGTINYKGTAGSDKSPEFGSGGVAYEARYEGLSAGTHRFELRNMADSVFVDGFCLTVTVPPQTVTNGGSGGGTTTPSTFTGTPTSGPGQSTSNDSSVNAGQESKSNVTLGANARALSLVAETSGNLPVKLALVSPTGLTLQIVDAVNGVAVLTTPVTQGGIYTVKVINVNLGPVQVWTVATPTVAR